MADTVLINHPFITAKPDSSDQTLVSANEWNANLVITGGADAQALLRDSSKSTGGRWTDGPGITTNTDTYAGSSPSPALCARTIVFATNAVIFLIVGVKAITSAGGQLTVALRRDTVNISSQPMEGGTGLFNVAAFAVQSEAPGTHTYDVVLSVSGQTFTSSTVQLATLRVGT